MMVILEETLEPPKMAKTGFSSVFRPYQLLRFLVEANPPYGFIGWKVLCNDGR